MASYLRYDGSTRTVRGEALSGASIAILSQPAVTTTQPGSPLVSLFGAAISNAATLSTASWNLGVISFTFSATPPADVVVGSYIQITAVNPVGYNSVWKVASVVGNVVTALSVTNPGLYVSGGTVATSALPNPFLTDNQGNYFFYAPAGTYTVQIYDTLGRISTQLLLIDQPIVVGGAGSGSVTSVGLIVPAEFTVSGSPISGSGAITIGKATVAQNSFYAGLSAGGAGLPVFRAIVAADLPVGGGTVTSVTLTVAVPAYMGAVITGSPLTTSGTLNITLTFNNENANLVFAGPSSGGAAAPGFRALVTADMPVGTGTVTSVTLTMPAEFTVAGSPITTSGTLAITKANAAQNSFFAGLATGGSGTPVFRAIVAADLPGTLLQQSTTVLSSANLLALLATPITLVAAPGVGFVIVPHFILIKFFGGAAAYTDIGGAVQFVQGSITVALATNAIFLVTVSPTKRLQQFPWPGGTDTAGNPPTDDNAPLQINKITNNFAAGNGTATIIVTYIIQPTT
jgi:hypothetical protein